MSKNTAPLPDWELVLSSAARLQSLLPGAVLVGGTASAMYVQHRFSHDADHVLTDLRHRFDDVLAQLESVAGWKTARIQGPVQIPGSLDGIETGVCQLIRDEPLETVIMDYHGEPITVPTEGEILRIKGVLILKRNATDETISTSWRWRITWAMRVLPPRWNRLTASIGRTTENPRCNSCRCSLPMRYPTIWRKPNSPNTKTSIDAGTTGRP